MKNIEIEFRSIITKEKHDSLMLFLSSNAEDLGEDNKETLFYILPEKIFKVVNEASKGKAKIVLKNNQLGNGSNFDEWEIEINPAEYEKAIDMFNHVNFAEKFIRAWQERHNFLYKGVEIAVKYSEHWNYHVEMEVVIEDMGKKEETEEQIHKVADELGIKLMTDEEIIKHIEPIRAKL